MTGPVDGTFLAVPFASALFATVEGVDDKTYEREGRAEAVAGGRLAAARVPPIESLRGKAQADDAIDATVEGERRREYPILRLSRFSLPRRYANRARADLRVVGGVPRGSVRASDDRGEPHGQCLHRRRGQRHCVLQPPDIHGLLRHERYVPRGNAGHDLWGCWSGMHRLHVGG
jgi:hypothetical protein